MTHTDDGRMDIDIEAVRRALGPVGAYVPVPFTRWIPMDEQVAAVRRFERAGFRTVWCNEGVGGKDVFAQLATLLAATERVTFATGIANIWARPPQTAHGAASVLAEAYPGRVLLGLGVGYAELAALVGRECGRPVATMRAYLDGMAEAPQMPGPQAPYARILAAMGPKMLALAGERADGAYPAGQPPEFTAAARTTLGPDKLLVVGLQTEADAEPPDIKEAIRAHLQAGADHVTLLLPAGEDFTSDVTRVEALAP